MMKQAFQRLSISAIGYQLSQLRSNYAIRREAAQ